MKTNLKINIAKDEYGNDLIIDLAQIRNLLIAGNTGSGKSTLIHEILNTLLTNNNSEYLKLILIDPKHVELFQYDGIPSLLTPVIFDPKKTILALKHMTKEMNRRFDTLKQNNVRDINQYHNEIVSSYLLKKAEIKAEMDTDSYFVGKNEIETMPNILVVVDEFSDIMQIYPREMESAIGNLIGTAHNVGIHLILSTSRTSTRIIIKTIRDTISARIAMQTSSIADSKLVIGTNDAHTLRGSGDMLYRDGMKFIVRAQVSNIDEIEIKKKVKELISKKKEEGYEQINLNDTSVIKSNGDAIFTSTFDTDDADIDEEDDLFEPAKQAVLESGKASTSLIQRKLGVGYSRAAKLIDDLEKKGIVGPANGASPREIYEENK